MAQKRAPEDDSNTSKHQPPCNQRIDVLSTPLKRMYLALWNDHAYHFEKDRTERLKEILQQLYAMTPEEATKYFADLRAQAKERALRKKAKQKVRKYLAARYHVHERQRAYRLFRRLLKCGIRYASEKPVTEIVSLRLRYLSDVILEQLANLREVEMPDRENLDKTGNFLVQVADWIAIAVERIYFSAQNTINDKMLDEPDPDVPDEKRVNYSESHAVTVINYDEMEPLAASTPRKKSSKWRSKCCF